MKKRIVTLSMMGSLLLALSTPVSAASDEWRHLSPKEKDTIQRNYKRWEKVPPKDKDHFRDEWDRVKRMPQDQRDRLRQRFDEQRRGHND